MAERIVGQGSFGVVFQVSTCIFFRMHLLIESSEALQYIYVCFINLLSLSCRQSAWRQGKLWQ